MKLQINPNFDLVQKYISTYITHVKAAKFDEALARMCNTLLDDGKPSIKKILKDYNISPDQTDNFCLIYLAIQQNCEKVKEERQSDYDSATEYEKQALEFSSLFAPAPWDENIYTLYPEAPDELIIKMPGKRNIKITSKTLIVNILNGGADVLSKLKKKGQLEKLNIRVKELEKPNQFTQIVKYQRTVVKQLYRFLTDTTQLKVKQKHDFIGQFLKISNIPLRYVNKEKGELISEESYPETIKKILQKRPRSTKK